MGLHATAIRAANWFRFNLLGLPECRAQRRLVLALALLCGCVIYVYDLQRILKGALAINQSGVGAEVLTYLKLYAVMPVAFILAPVFMFLLRHYRIEHVYLAMSGFYMVFYALFGFVLYPNLKHVELRLLLPGPTSPLPSGLQVVAIMLAQWPISLFYVLTEMWAAYGITVLFWSFVNSRLSFELGSRYFPLLTLTASLAAALVGITTELVEPAVRMPEIMAYFHAAEASVAINCTISVAVLALSWYLMWRLRPTSGAPADGDHRAATEITRRQDQRSLRDVFAILARDSHILAIAVLVICYNAFFNLFEVIFEGSLRHYCGNDLIKMCTIKGRLTLANGIGSALISMLATRRLLARYGWTRVAAMTPVVLGVLGAILFGVMIAAGRDSEPWARLGWGGLSLGQLVVAVGFIQILASRCLKYTLFDNSKELAYYPLDPERVQMGKSVVDGFGSRLGKSFGSLSIQLGVLGFGSLDASLPFLAAVALLILLAWGWGVATIHHRMPRST